jgi:hypothetical protein
MITFTRFLTIVGLAVVFVTPALADDLANTFEEAAARGEAQKRAASTKNYFTNTLMPYYGQKYAPVLQSCFATITKPDNSHFSFVAAIGADGRIVRLYRDRETNISLCMRDTLEKEVFPPPPASPYYLHIEMNFSDDDVPKSSNKESAPPLILEPGKYSYTFDVPEGWEYSFDQAQEFGARLAFFPKGGGFRSSNSIVYVTEIDGLCVANCAGAVPRAIARELQKSREDSPTLKVAIGSSLKIKEGGEARVRILTGANDPRQAKEALAFIEHNETIVLVVLTTGDTKTWDQDYRAFQEIVSGHKFFNCNSPDLAASCHP